MTNAENVLVMSCVEKKSAGFEDRVFSMGKNICRKTVANNTVKIIIISNAEIINGMQIFKFPLQVL